LCEALGLDISRGQRFGLGGYWGRMPDKGSHLLGRRRRHIHLDRGFRDGGTARRFVEGFDWLVESGWWRRTHRLGR
jgi:hypothetical protein